jgi:hypothetical protein
MHMAERAPHARERSFGVSVGGVLLAIAAFQVWRGRPGYAEVLGGIGLVLFVLGRTRPALLAWPSALWWRFAAVLGYVNARIILTAAFAIVLTPVGLLWRLVERDPLAYRRDHWQGWTPHPARYRKTDHYTRMY